MLAQSLVSGSHDDQNGFGIDMADLHVICDPHGISKSHLSGCNCIPYYARTFSNLSVSIYRGSGPQAPKTCSFQEEDV